jgi:hypothetical protein
LSVIKIGTCIRLFWLNKLIQEGIDAGMFEPTVVAIGQLSDWSAEPNLVDKFDGPGEWDEPRLTLNYSHVEENLLGTNITKQRVVPIELAKLGPGYVRILSFISRDTKRKAAALVKKLVEAGRVFPNDTLF